MIPMKIKESSSKIKYSQTLTVFAVSAALLTILRIFQIKTSIDASTGFYTKTGFLVVAFYVLLAASCLYSAVSAFISADSKNVTLKNKKSLSMFWLSLIYSFLLFFDGVSCFFKSVYTTGDTQVTGTVFKSLMTSGAIPLFLQSIFAILSGIFFIELAVSFKKGNGSAGKHRILALMPVGWVSCRLLHLFIRKISFLRVSDLFLELAMCAFMVLFFMAFAQASSDVYSTDSRWRLIGFGIPAATLAAIISIPRLFFTIVDKSTYINENHTFNIVDLAFLVFMAILALQFLKKEIPTATAEEEESDIVS